MCVHGSVSGESRGGQGNKSEQRGVMRVGWSAAVINTMLGSTSGHTFGSSKIKNQNKTLLIFFSEQLFLILVIDDLFDILA